VRLGVDNVVAVKYQPNHWKFVFCKGTSW